MLCADYPCTSVTATSPTGATSASLTVAPGRYGYRVELLEATGAVVGFTATRPFEVLSAGTATAVAVGTSLHVNPLDFDRDFVVGTRTQGAFFELALIAATFALPVPGDPSALPAFGRRIANAGDFNGDGYSDLGVVSQSATDPMMRPASLFLRIPLTGNARAYNVVHNTFPVPNTSATQPAWSIAGGDINGDGFSDLIVGAPSSTASNGAATIVYDAETFVPSAIPTSSTTIRGSAPSFGGAVASGCDFDGDGFADFAVSSVSLDAMDTTARPVQVYFGGAAPPYASTSIDPPGTTWRTLTAWEPATGEGHGVTMAH